MAAKAVLSHLKALYNTVAAVKLWQLWLSLYGWINV